MIQIIIELSLFMIVAILLGYTFGWFTAKATVKEKYTDQMDELRSLYENDLSKIKEIKANLDEHKALLKSKDATIKKLTKRHEEEMDAFLYERTEITQKYKELLAQVEREEDNHL